MASPSTLYTLLDVAESATFAEMKRAYYRRAKACHPDLHAGSARKEEEFKRLVQAFNVLSDPDQRQAYDEQLRFARDIDELPAQARHDGYYRHDGDAIMDCIADDILEELVVGNHVPHGATLQTLMRDLESTHKFIRFREAKNHYSEQRFEPAFHLFRQSTTDSPGNIVYHYYLGVCAHHLRMNTLARSHLQVCLQLGAARVPPQSLRRVRQALQRVRRPYPSLFSRFLRALKPPEDPRRQTTEETMIEEMNRSITRLMRQRAKQQRIEQRQQKRLADKRHPPDNSTR